METIVPKECGAAGIQHPLVSVIIPVYNGDKFIDACLDSIDRQTYRPMEIIVVNDGSTDQSALRAEGHGSKPVVITTPNCNLPSARNTGIRLAKGEYIAFCDVDDLWLPEKIEKQVERLSTHPEDGLVFTDFAVIGAMGGEQKKRKPGALERRFNRGNQFEILVRKNIIAPSSVMVRRSVLDLVGTFDEHLLSCEDWDLWLRIARGNASMFRIASPLTLYRRHAGNMSKKAEVMHLSRISVLKKAFKGYPATRKSLRLKRKSFALACFEAANGFYSLGDFEKFRQCYREAIRYGSVLLSLKAFRRFIKDRVSGKRTGK